MNTPVLGLPLSASIPGRVKNKRVLLLDNSSSTRDLRAETMRKLGVDVDCAADVSEARSWWRADLYNLVLIDTPTEPKNRDKFCEDLRRATPPQQVAFLVGKPSYLSHAPGEDEAEFLPGNGHQVPEDLVRAALAADLPGGDPQRWGILEASRRISAVRCLSHARTRAKQDRVAPVRDMETREFKRLGGGSRNLDDLLREELQ
jgi:CheY-like chemotaxis protein